MNFVCINETEDGLFLTNSIGFILDAEEQIKIAKNIIKFCKNHKQEIVDYNANYNPYEWSENMIKTDKPPNKYCVYIMKSSDKYKIGISKNVKRRYKEIKRYTCDLELIYSTEEFEGAYDIEQTLHDIYKEKRLFGEWFALTEKDVNIIINYLES